MPHCRSAPLCGHWGQWWQSLVAVEAEWTQTKTPSVDACAGRILCQSVFRIFRFWTDPPEKRVTSTARSEWASWQRTSSAVALKRLLLLTPTPPPPSSPSSPPQVDEKRLYSSGVVTSITNSVKHARQFYELTNRSYLQRLATMRGDDIKQVCVCACVRVCAQP